MSRNIGGFGFGSLSSAAAAAAPTSSLFSGSGSSSSSDFGFGFGFGSLGGIGSSSSGSGSFGGGSFGGSGSGSGPSLWSKPSASGPRGSASGPRGAFAGGGFGGFGDYSAFSRPVNLLGSGSSSGPRSGRLNNKGLGMSESEQLAQALKASMSPVYGAPGADPGLAVALDASLRDQGGAPPQGAPGQAEPKASESLFEQVFTRGSDKILCECGKKEWLEKDLPNATDSCEQDPLTVSFMKTAACYPGKVCNAAYRFWQSFRFKDPFGDRAITIERLVTCQKSRWLTEYMFSGMAGDEPMVWFCYIFKKNLVENVRYLIMNHFYMQNVYSTIKSYFETPFCSKTAQRGQVNTFHERDLDHYHYVVPCERKWHGFLLDVIDLQYKSASNDQQAKIKGVISKSMKSFLKYTQTVVFNKDEKFFSSDHILTNLNINNIGYTIHKDNSFSLQWIDCRRGARVRDLESFKVFDNRLPRQHTFIYSLILAYGKMKSDPKYVDELHHLIPNVYLTCLTSSPAFTESEQGYQPITDDQWAEASELFSNQEHMKHAFLQMEESIQLLQIAEARNSDGKYPPIGTQFIDTEQDEESQDDGSQGEEGAIEYRLDDFEIAPGRMDEYNAWRTTLLEADKLLSGLNYPPYPEARQIIQGTQELHALAVNVAMSKAKMEIAQRAMFAYLGSGFNDFHPYTMFDVYSVPILEKHVIIGSSNSHAERRVIHVLRLDERHTSTAQKHIQRMFANHDFVYQVSRNFPSPLTSPLVYSDAPNSAMPSVGFKKEVWCAYYESVKLWDGKFTALLDHVALSSLSDNAKTTAIHQLSDLLCGLLRATVDIAKDNEAYICWMDIENIGFRLLSRLQIDLMWISPDGLCFGLPEKLDWPRKDDKQCLKIPFINWLQLFTWGSLFEHVNSKPKQYKDLVAPLLDAVWVTAMKDHPTLRAAGLDNTTSFDNDKVQSLKELFREEDFMNECVTWLAEALAKWNVDNYNKKTFQKLHLKKEGVWIQHAEKLLMQ